MKRNEIGQTFAIIGAGYGDEGKGLLTDYLVRQHSSMQVLRFNGGAQAGHTVKEAEGRSHIFGHVGSGSFAGASTILGERFIINPYLLDVEMQRLVSKGVVPKVFAHKSAIVTTVFDMALNAVVVLSRGADRHGSCGVGINETVTRSHGGFCLTAGEVATLSIPDLADLLEVILQTWVPRRLDKLGIKSISADLHDRTGGVLLSTSYLEHAKQLKSGIGWAEVGDYSDAPWDLQEPLILEGAQGLGLDEDLGTFPYVTRSLTGLPSAIEAAVGMGADSLQPVYVTRCYATRHGAGPLAHESETITEATITDTTNKVNEWQGSLRFAPLDLDVLKRSIHRDLDRADAIRLPLDAQVLSPVLAVTCLDQLGQSAVMWSGDKRWVVPKEEVAGFISEKTGIPLGYISTGPTSENVAQVYGSGV
jgi:adenylosuccinate synthase